MEQKWAAYSFDYPLVECFIIVAYFDFLYSTSFCHYVNASDFSFFDLDLLFCTISGANEWARTFIYSFINETRTFFVTLDVSLKNCFMYEKLF